tara:strand:+ start:2723 stop:3616 length:894 start_codon:yes stop_codon:yes gene_type:complete
MIIPPKLNKGDKVALIATARHISKNELLPAIQVIHKWGLQIEYGENLFKIHNQFAGSEKERSDDLQKMLDDKSIKAVFCVRGGYGTVRIIDNIDFSFFLNNPKWIVGYSDITVLHNHINNFGIASLHASMPINFKDNTAKSLNSIYNCLFELQNNIACNPFPLNKFGVAKGEVVGGNLSVIYSLLGSASDINTKDKILFIEDLDEYLYHIDRMIFNLFRNKKFSSIRGLIVGGMTKMNDNKIPFGKNANEIIFEKTIHLNIPICFNFPSGHLDDNQSIVFGKESSLMVSEEIVELKQ